MCDIISKETSVCYCSKTIQKESISVVASCVRDNILERARKAKYFSIILDCTPDLSHREQMSFTLRFEDVCESDLIVQEHFITFQETEETTGQSLFVVIKKLLEDSKLGIKNCKGQGYDNGSDMRGKNRGIQARIRQENPRAFLCLVVATL
jgi:hypothetical protein